MKLTEAVDALKGKMVTATTASGTVVKGTLKEVGDDYVDVHWATGRSTIVPFAQLASLKEE
jgi:hypothetical protein